MSKLDLGRLADLVEKIRTRERRDDYAIDGSFAAKVRLAAIPTLVENMTKEASARIKARHAARLREIASLQDALDQLKVSALTQQSTDEEKENVQ